jgi:toxin FitB
MLTSKPQVVDTSAWIEWLLKSAAGISMRGKFPLPRDCIVPTVVQLELSKWFRRETSVVPHDDVLTITNSCTVTPLCSELALLAAQMNVRYRLATADAVIYATARRGGALLLTCDAHFKGLPGVAYYAKHGGPPELSEPPVIYAARRSPTQRESARAARHVTPTRSSPAACSTRRTSPG